MHKNLLLLLSDSCLTRRLGSELCERNVDILPIDSVDKALGVIGAIDIDIVVFCIDDFKGFHKKVTGEIPIIGITTKKEPEKVEGLTICSAYNLTEEVLKALRT